MTERQNYWQRMARKRMNRRSLLRASSRAGVGAAGLALVGCGDDDDDGQQAVASVQQQQQAQQQAAQQQAMQQQQQQAMQQDQEQQADQSAAQADQQEQTQQDQADQAQQQAVADTSGLTRGGTLRFSTPAATHDYFDPHRAVFGPTQFWMGFYMNYLIRWRNKEKGIMESDIASLPEGSRRHHLHLQHRPGSAFLGPLPDGGWTAGHGGGHSIQLSTADRLGRRGRR